MTIKIFNHLDFMGMKDKWGMVLSDSEYEYWKQGQKKDEDAISTDRSFQLYCGYFRLDPEKLRGKLILDIGSGFKETFSKQASKYGAIVYSLTPSLRLKKTRKEVQRPIKGKLPWQERSVAARVQNIPFPDDTFDLVLAFNSAPCYLFLLEDIFLATREMVRVAKPLGKVMIASREDTRNHLPSSIVRWLKQNGYNVDNKTCYETQIITKKESGVYPKRGRWDDSISLPVWCGPHFVSVKAGHQS